MANLFIYALHKERSRGGALPTLQECTHIDDVGSNELYDYVCPHCDGALLAKCLGYGVQYERTPHFAHIKNTCGVKGLDYQETMVRRNKVTKLKPNPKAKKTEPVKAHKPKAKTTSYSTEMVMRAINKVNANYLASGEGDKCLDAVRLYLLHNFLHDTDMLDMNKEVITKLSSRFNKSEPITDLYDFAKLLEHAEPLHVSNVLNFDEKY